MEQGRAIPAVEASEARAYEGDVPGERAWLWIPRAVLFVPRMVLRYVVFAPLKAVLGLYMEWRDEPGARLFVNSLIRTDFRSRFGLGYSTGPIFGSGEGFSVGFSYGGRNFQTYELSWREQLSGGVGLLLEGRYDRDGDEQFYGLGNDQPEEARTRFFQEQWTGTAGLRVDWGRTLRTELGGGWTRILADDVRDEGDIADGERTVSARFDPDLVPAFGQELDFAVASFQTRLDLRGRRAGDAPELMLRGHADAYFDLEDRGYSTLRYGGQLDVGVPLVPRRILAARFLLEAAEPLASDEQVPFHLLPAAGRGDVLRGYPSGRLRDRILTVAGLEYRWEIARDADAFAFVDTGRVFGDYASFDFSGWKWGAGGGLRIKGGNGRPLVAFQAAYSPEMIELVVTTGSRLF